MIIAYAKKHGLSDKKYQMLMASRHAGLAPQLRPGSKTAAAGETEKFIPAFDAIAGVGV